MSGSEESADQGVTWVVDATLAACYVAAPAAMAAFEATLAILEADCTVGEFVERMAEHDTEILLSIFGTDSADEIRRMADAGDIAAFDEPWSPDNISSYDLVPDNRAFFSEAGAPGVLDDLFEDVDIYGEFRSIPSERHPEVIDRLQKAGIPYVERPGAVADLVARVRGGSLR